MTNQRDVYVNVDDEEPKRFPWGWIIGVILLILLGFMAVKWIDARITRNAEMAVAAAVAEMQPVVVNDKSEEVAIIKTIGSVSDSGDTYFPELSCSHLESCLISEVPRGYFTIGFADNGNGCDWILYEAGETIDYSEIDEFHTYNNLLPLTELEGFVAAQFQYVFACTHNN